MPSKRIYEIQFNKENNRFGIEVTDEFGAPHSEYNFNSFLTIEEAKELMENLKKAMHDNTANDSFSEIVYVSPDRFEIIRHR